MNSRLACTRRVCVYERSEWDECTISGVHFGGSTCGMYPKSLILFAPRDGRHFFHLDNNDPHPSSPKNPKDFWGRRRRGGEPRAEPALRQALRPAQGKLGDQLRS